MCVSKEEIHPPYIQPFNQPLINWSTHLQPGQHANRSTIQPGSHAVPHPTNPLTLCLNHSQQKQCLSCVSQIKKIKKQGEIHTFNNDSPRNWREVYYSLVLHKSIKQMPFNAPAPTCQRKAVQSQHTDRHASFSSFVRTLLKIQVTLFPLC